MTNNSFGYDEDIVPEKTKNQRIEELIIPLLDNLINTSDKEIIKWPNRKVPLEKLKKDILKLTRS